MKPVLSLVAPWRDPYAEILSDGAPLGRIEWDAEWSVWRCTDSLRHRLALPGWTVRLGWRPGAELEEVGRSLAGMSGHAMGAVRVV